MECKILNYYDEEYPEKLRKINNMPKIIYYIGNISLLNKPSIAIVGTRNITEYGKKYGKIFSTELAKKFVIVSGMAIGVDTIAHRSALDIGCETIAVLGCGFNNIFPKENENLFYEIINKNGLVISEYKPEQIAISKFFPKRNRIVSGISDGVLVIEAGYRSGTSITVNFAKKQGKNVYALPGRLDNEYGIGVNKMIQDGAYLVTSPKDILERYPQIIEKKWKEKDESKKIKEEYLEIYKLLKEEQKDLEQISVELNRPIRDIAILLTKMEIDGVIKKDIGKGYYIAEHE